MKIENKILNTRTQFTLVLGVDGGSNSGFEISNPSKASSSKE